MQGLKCEENALVLLRQLLVGCSALSLLFYPKTSISLMLFLNAIFQPVCHYLQGLPSNLPKIRLRQCKLLHIFRPLYQFHRPTVHPLLFLCSSKRIHILQKNLILAKDHKPLEKNINSEVQIVVIVAFHPLLDEVVVPRGGQHDPI